MYPQIARYCAQCTPCQLRKTPTSYNKQPLSPWPSTTEPLARVAVDIFDPIKMSRKGNTVVLVMIDFLTRYVWARPLPNQTAITIARELLNIFLEVGFPQQLVSDSGTNFTSNILTALCQLLHVDKYTVTTAHHSSNGLVERFMRTLQAAVTPFTDSDQSNWCDVIPFVVFAYNSSTQRPVGYSPFLLMYNREPRLPLDNILHHQVSMCNEDPSFTDRVAMNFQLLEHTQKQQKQRHDTTTKSASFQTGDDVFILDTTPPINKSRKLTNKYKGPFRCVDISGNHLTLIQDKPGAKPFTWHVELAKPARITKPLETTKTGNMKTAQQTSNFAAPAQPHQMNGHRSKDQPSTEPERSPTILRKPRIQTQYPLDAPAPNRYPLRSKFMNNYITHKSRY